MNPVGPTEHQSELSGEPANAGHRVRKDQTLRQDLRQIRAEIAQLRVEALRELASIRSSLSGILSRMQSESDNAASTPQSHLPSTEREYRPLPMPPSDELARNIKVLTLFNSAALEYNKSLPLGNRIELMTDTQHKQSAVRLFRSFFHLWYC